MDLNLQDYIVLLHPTLAVAVVFPLIGMVVKMAWQTRQRRLDTLSGKSKLPPTVGSEHVALGRWLTGAVVGVVLVALASGIYESIFEGQIWQKDAAKVGLISAFFGATIAALVLLYQAQSKLWRGIFATFTGMGLIILGAQDGVYRDDARWYFSHYYYGIAASLLMIFSLAILRDIYQDRTNRWRTVHIALNCVALVFFVVQGFTGARSLLEIPLSWQKSYVYQCNFDSASPQYKTCPAPAPKP
jgi:peptidoglycan/LPS O-acetylase OafA/YrhL